MSKFIDALNEAGQGPSAPMGFGASVASKGPPEIVLVARVMPDELAKTPRLRDAAADGFLVAAPEGKAALDAVSEALSGLTWGVRNELFRAGDAAVLPESGCDFIVFESMYTEAGVLNTEDFGVVPTVDLEGARLSQMEDEDIRALSRLNVGAFLFGPSLRTLPLTIQAAIGIEKVLGLVHKPLVVEAPEGIDKADIEVLRDIGVSGLIVDLDSSADMDRIAKIRTDIETLPKPKPKSRGRDALLPAVESSLEPGEIEDDDNDEDDGDDF